MVPSRRSFLTILRALVASSSLALAACDAPSLLAPVGRISGWAEEPFGAGLVQVVTISPAALLDGNDIEVRSVIRNAGLVTIPLESRVCGLDYAGSLEVVSFLLHCAAYSQSTQLAPGDSVVTTDVLRVASPPGRYELQVRHAVSPEHWATVPTLVRD
ncbi:MAG: hypothetical protein OEW77_07315 [Gemmatimonadota bacterium]|nr:hypothetical protein [Gemmatimonadota bacterium]